MGQYCVYGVTCTYLMNSLHNRMVSPHFIDVCVDNQNASQALTSLRKTSYSIRGLYRLAQSPVQETQEALLSYTWCDLIFATSAR